MKKLYLLMTMLMLMISSAFAVPNADFFSQTPILTTYNSTTGVGQIDFDVDTQGANLITATIEIIHPLAGVVATDVTTSLSARDAVTYNFNLATLGNYNSDNYIARVTLTNEDTPAEQEINEDITFSYTGGILFSQELIGGLAKVDNTLGELFAVLATIIGAVVGLITGDLLVLTIVGAFISLIVGIIFLILRFVKTSVNQGTKK